MDETLEELNIRAKALDVQTQRLIRTIQVGRFQRLLLNVLVAAAATLGWFTYAQSQTNHRQAVANHKTALLSQQALHQIESCTVPSGDCYKRGANATGQAVASINKYTLIVVECAREGGDDAVVEKCVQLRVAELLGK